MAALRSAFSPSLLRRSHMVKTGNISKSPGTQNLYLRSMVIMLTRFASRLVDPMFGPDAYN